MVVDVCRTHFDLEKSKPAHESLTRQADLHLVMVFAFSSSLPPRLCFFGLFSNPDTLAADTDDRRCAYVTFTTV